MWGAEPMSGLPSGCHTGVEGLCVCIPRDPVNTTAVLYRPPATGNDRFRVQGGLTTVVECGCKIETGVSKCSCRANIFESHGAWVQGCDWGWAQVVWVRQSRGIGLKCLHQEKSRSEGAESMSMVEEKQSGHDVSELESLQYSGILGTYGPQCG